MTNDVEHLFIWLFANVSAVFSELAVKAFCPLLIGLFIFLSLSFKSPFYILDTSPLSDTCFANTFSLSVACLFTSNSALLRLEVLSSRKDQLTNVMSGIMLF